MKNEKIFLKKLIKLIKFHYKNCSEYKIFIDNSNVKLNSINKIQNLPFIHINTFKDFSLYSVKNKKIVTRLFSSGTSGESRSTIFLDKENVILQKKTLLNLLKKNISEERLPMIILDKHPSYIDKSSYSAKIAAIYGFSLIGKDYFYLLNKYGKINYIGLFNFLKIHKNKKIFLFGFTYDVFLNLIKNFRSKSSIDLSNSILLHGGGWKKMEKMKIGKIEFKNKLKSKFKINKIINYYGLVEQTGSIFFECDKCNNLISNEYASVIIRNSSLEECLYNQKGLVQLLSVVPKSYPGNSILTEDLGIFVKNNCKHHGNFKSFNILGRIKKVEVRGCSDAN